MHTLTTQTASSQLVFVDIQTKLAPAMQVDDMASVRKNTVILAQAAALLAVPMLSTAQYPKALGPTIPALAEHLNHTPPVPCIEKVHFACTAVEDFCLQLSQARPQVILTGVEAHICILQTALGLLAMDKQVFIVEDAIASRQTAHKQNAIARLRAAGCVITNTESIVFEWLEKAGGEHFKVISQLIR